MLQARPNVLFIAVDDLRPELGCYGADHIVSPNIDKLAASGVRFDRAYCQQAICGPSRASVMTGRRPDSTSVHGNHTHFRKIDPDIVTLPQHFKNHGYHTQSMGKIYHGVFPPGSSRTVADTFGDEPSWSVPTFRPGPRYYYTEEGVAAAKQVFKKLYGKGDWRQKLVFGPATEAPEVEDSVLYDGQVADRAVATLEALAKKKDKPFFLAVGFIKPHSPYIAPKKYWDLYDEKEVALASDQALPEDAPSLAGHGSGELRRYTDQKKRGPIPEADQRKVRHAYYACVYYIDAQVGKVLDALEEQGLAEDTIVVLWSDHGYHLGEKGLWGKTTNYELDTRVPLIVRAPGRKGNGKASGALVELVDLYPTLAEFAGLPVEDHLEGTSFVPLLDDPEKRWKKAAFSQFTRGKHRGYAIATEFDRYVEWYEIGTSNLVARELYFHREDSAERMNVAEGRDYAVSHFSRLLDRGEGWRHTLPNPEFTVAAIFGDNMVLQRGKPLTIWGTARPGAEVNVTFGDARFKGRAENDGNWAVHSEVDPLKPSGEGKPLIVTCGQHRKVFENVVVGDVWICAGQSNMRWMVRQSSGGSSAIAAADNPNLRLIDFKGRVYPNARRYSVAELRKGSIEGYYTTEGWRSASPESVADFSAVAYFFGSKLQRELDVPIGLIHNAVGGVPMETYIPREAFETDPKLKPLLDDWINNDGIPTWVRKRAGQNLTAWIDKPTGLRPRHPFEPGFLFEAGLRPLVGMAHSGFIWYQGESNATEDGANSAVIDPAANEHKFKTLIRSWRRAWDEPKLPFYFVQLPGLNRDWAPFREVQRKVAEDLKHVGMAVTYDVGHPTNVHPASKKPVGERLALQALAKTYGRTTIDPDGPKLVGHSVVGDGIQLKFDKRVFTGNGKAPFGFTIAGADKLFHPAKGVIDGNNVRISSPRVKAPVAARYAWANDPDADLTNRQGMLASPFRTDGFALVAAPRPIPDGAMSFEGSKPGEFTELLTASGKWTAKPGHAEVNGKFAHSGRQSLHIFGGEDRQVEFTPIDAQMPWGQLSFRAERWTVRKPFAFRIEALENGKWKEIYNGDHKIKVGARFLSQVAVPVPAKLEKFRFTCTAPKNSGILIDDVRLAPAKEMEVNVFLGWPVNPVLIGRPENPALRINCHADGNLNPKTVRSLQVSVAESDHVADIKSVRILVDGEPFGESMKPAETMMFRGERELKDGDNTFVVHLELADEASLDRSVKATCHGIGFEKSFKTPIAHAIGQGKLRIGVAVRQSGQDKCHTYRIPGLATTNKGTLIAVYDNRYRGGGDLPGDIDVGLSRSTDGGQTWEPMKVIMDMGDDPKWRYDGIGDPAVLVDRKTNTIWVAATWSHGNRSWHGSGPGMKPEETGQFMLVKSEDDGLTWSKPINITSQIKDPKWRFVLQGPGKGITLKDGTLVFPAQFRGENEAPVNGKPFSTLIYSVDGGETWTIGTGVKIDTTEAQLVELGDGSIMINCRDNRGGSRSVYTTTDLGKTWKAHQTTRGSLPEPVCMASLIRVEQPKHGSVLFFSNPPQARGRHHMTIKASRDEGNTWPKRYHTLIDERFSAYSCMTRVGEDKVGLLYEGVRGLFFVRVPIAELLGESK